MWGGVGAREPSTPPAPVLDTNMFLRSPFLQTGSGSSLPPSPAPDRRTAVRRLIADMLTGRLNKNYPDSRSDRWVVVYVKFTLKLHLEGRKVYS